MNILNIVAVLTLLLCSHTNGLTCYVCGTCDESERFVECPDSEDVVHDKCYSSYSSGILSKGCATSAYQKQVGSSEECEHKGPGKDRICFCNQNLCNAAGNEKSFSSMMLFVISLLLITFWF